MEIRYTSIIRPAILVVRVSLLLIDASIWPGILGPDVHASVEMLDQCFRQTSLIVDQVKWTPPFMGYDKPLADIRLVQNQLSGCNWRVLKEFDSGDQFCQVVDMTVLTENLCQKMAGDVMETPVVDLNFGGPIVQEVVEAGRDLGVWGPDCVYRPQRP